MNIEFRDGLLFTEIKISFNGRSKIVQNIVIDTGASHTLISQDEVDELGIRVAKDDHFITSFGTGGEEHAFIKTVQSIEIGDYKLNNIDLDFTSFIDLYTLELLRLQ